MVKAGTLMAAAELLPRIDEEYARVEGALRGGGAGVDLIAAQASILIVDDEPLNRMLRSRDIERPGHLVATVADGGQALEALRTRFRMTVRAGCRQAAYPLMRISPV